MVSRRDPAGHGTRATCWSTSARSRRVLPAARAGAGRDATSTASRIALLRRAGAQGRRAGRRSRCRAPTRTWCGSSSRSRCRRSPTAPSRSPRSPGRPVTAPRSRCSRTGPGVNAKGACIGPMGSRVRAVMTELHGEKIDIVDWSEDPAEFVARRCPPAKVQRGGGRRRGGPLGPRHRAGLPALAGDRREGQNARLAARLTGWRIDIRPDIVPAGPDDRSRRGRRRGRGAGRGCGRRGAAAAGAAPREA